MVLTTVVVALVTAFITVAMVVLLTTGAVPAAVAGLLAALPTATLVTGRASLAVRLWTPIAKALQRALGNGRTSSGAEA